MALCEHPPCDRAVEIVEQNQQSRHPTQKPSDLVFTKRGKPLSTLTRLPLVKAAGVTVHGFRSSFRDWAGDCTHVARETIEFALAHGITDATEAAYRRSTALEKRRDVPAFYGTDCAKMAKWRARSSIAGSET